MFRLGVRHVAIATALFLCLAAAAVPRIYGLAPGIAAIDHPHAPRAGRPDIVLVTIDALRADHLGAYGYARLTSPAIDAFAHDSVVFTNAIAQAPYTKA